jgi:uncharacterized protein (TIGR00255 family)
MLNSMTGFGSAAADDHGISCTVEIRAVNNRFLKTVIKLPDKLANLEPDIERVMRDRIARGSVVLAVSVKDTVAPTAVAVNEEVLQIYIQQAKAAYHALVSGDNKIPGASIDVANLLALPGVVSAGEDSVEYLATHQELVIRLVKQAIIKLGEMRAKEGAALWADLKKHLDIVRSALAKIAEHAPQVVRNYHEKLKARVNQMVSDAKLSLSDQDLLKEVALFADRADISEEISRLGGHLDQFFAVCDRGGAAPSGESAGVGGGDGRKLDFIAQEMLREANTIASKANDSNIARLTVDIKSAIDRIKEQVQNVE